MRENGESAPGARGAQRRGAGRPRGRVLSRELILETGLRLIDERGESGAGMRAIAQELGVRPSSLYNHVSGRDELIAGIRELISDRIDVECFERLPWDRALECWAGSYRSAFAAHPPTIALLATASLTPDSRTSFMYDAVAAALVRAGWPEARALSVIVAVESFLLGAALDAAAAPDMLDPGPRADVPAFSGAYAARERALAAGGERPADEAYRLGLAAMIAGLRVEFSALPGTDPVPAGAVPAGAVPADAAPADAAPAGAVPAGAVPASAAPADAAPAGAVPAGAVPVDAAPADAAPADAAPADAAPADPA